MRGKTVLIPVAVTIAITASMLAFAGATGAQSGVRIGQPAPEITGGPWINSGPLSMDKLRGRVVFVEFWTFG
jgi:hypothetical protein